LSKLDDFLAEIIPRHVAARAPARRRRAAHRLSTGYRAGPISGVI
jgi:hypothetical protein